MAAGTPCGFRAGEQRSGVGGVLEVDIGQARRQQRGQAIEIIGAELIQERTAEFGHC